MESVHRMEVNLDGPDNKKRSIPTSAKQHKGKPGITMVDLSAEWNEVVEALRSDGVQVTNPDHALEGALLIRYYKLHHVERVLGDRLVLLLIPYVDTTGHVLFYHAVGYDMSRG